MGVSRFCCDIQAAHTSRLALLSSALYVPAGLALCALAFTSMRFNERNVHCFISLGFGGIAFTCAPSTPRQPAAPYDLTGSQHSV